MKLLFFFLVGFFLTDVSSQTSNPACDHKHIAGPQGLPGPVGPQGLPGTIGSRGPPGPPGGAGPVGERGLVGARGIKGDKGDRGNIGRQGTTGKAGAKGEKGNRGFPGVTGLEGSKGDKGHMGHQGHKGQKGEKGIQGLPGVMSIELLRQQLEDLGILVIGCDCSCLHKRSPHLSSGVFTIVFAGIDPIPVYCDMETDGGGWTVFQRRKDGSVDFNRGWDDYEKGFGNPNGEYWLGLATLHLLLKVNGANELRIDLKDASSNSAYAKYSSFRVGDSSSKYRLNVSGYSGTAGDAIAASGNFQHQYDSNGMKFSTKDQDNDLASNHCAALKKDGWWYNACYSTSLNNWPQGGTKMVWYTWRQWESLSFSEMKFRKA